MQRIKNLMQVACVTACTLLFTTGIAQAQGVQQSIVSNPQLATGNGPWGASRLNANDRIVIQAPTNAAQLHNGIQGDGGNTWGICRSITNNSSNDIFVPWHDQAGTHVEWTAFLNALGTGSLANVSASTCCAPSNAVVCGTTYTDATTGNPLPLGYRALGAVLNGENYTMSGTTAIVTSTPKDKTIDTATMNNWGAQGDIMGPLFSTKAGINYQVTYVCYGGNWVKTREIGSCTPVNGTCASPGYMLSLPADLQSLCGAGSTFSGLQTNATGWTWTCLGSGSGMSNALCQAYNQQPVNGQCGPINDPTNSGPAYTSGQMAGMLPAQVCTTGTFSGSFGNAADTSAHWKWQCLGQYGGNDSPTCLVMAAVINGVCGTDNGKTFTVNQSPGNNLCVGAGIASTPVFNSVANTWSWSCTGTGGGSNATCGASYNPNYVAGNCGSDNGGTFAPGTLSPTDPNLCTGGTVSNFSSSNSYAPYYWQWTCTGADGGNNQTCAAYDTPPLNGQCGADNLGYFPSGLSANDANLCSAGTVATFNGSSSNAPYYYGWSCQGTGGGSNVNCSAYNTAGLTNGQCGSAAGVASATPPSTGLCAQGTWTSVNENNAGTQWLWTCNGTSGGTNINCTAPVQQAFANGVCGTANGTAIPNTPNFNLCSSGSPSPISGSGPWTWTCTGSGGGNDSPQCEAQLCQACSGTITQQESVTRTGTAGQCRITASGTWTDSDALVAGTANPVTVSWTDNLGSFSRVVEAVAATYPTYCPPCYMQLQSISGLSVTVDKATGSGCSVQTGDKLSISNLSVH